MNDLIEYLRSFNAKERYFLLGRILANPELKPALPFLHEMSRVLGIEIPQAVFSAMDYHLDWLFVSLNLAAEAPVDAVHRNDELIVKGQQEDVDFLIAFESEGIWHVILVEAKGVTGWADKQMRSKAHRLKAIFGEDGKRWPKVVPHFVLISPHLPETLDYSSWPGWMAPSGRLPWMQLRIPQGLKAVARCNPDGKKDKNGTFWKVVVRRFQRLIG